MKKTGTARKAIPAEALATVNTAMAEHDALLAQAQKHLQVERPDLAIALLLQYVRLERDTTALNLLGNAYVLSKRPQDAQASFRRSLGLRDNPNADAWNGLGVACQETGESPEAHRAFQTAAAQAPKRADILRNLGVSASAMADWKAAAEAFSASFAQTPEMSTFNAWAQALRKRADLPGLLVAYESGFRHFPKDITLLNELGNLHVDCGDYTAADEVFSHALRLRPQSSPALVGLGIARYKQGRNAESIDLYKAALAVNPDSIAAHKNRAMSLLKARQFVEGWRDYEWRIQVPGFVGRKFSAPRWQGESLAGKTILVLMEQGFGDTIQFARYLPWLKAQGVTVLLECKPELAPLFEACSFVDKVLRRFGTANQSRPEPAPFHDYYCFLMSLPFYQEGSFTVEAAASDLFPLAADKVAYWQTLLAKRPGLRIGVAWAGNPQAVTGLVRACPVSYWQALFAVSGATFYSIQKAMDGSESHAGADTNRTEKLVPLGDQLGDFADTFALVSQLDLVITVDTSLVHVAGTLGVPTLCLLPFEADWRWFEETGASSWYPSVQLFRQTVPGNWKGLLGTAQEALKQWIEAR